MLSRDENELITRVGPGTPMGELFRRYWIPAVLSEEIPEPDSPPVRVRLLGEDLVAFRDTQRRVGLLHEHCSHRLASLFFGRNEECGLRCIYHGWKYDVEGNILETPAEPTNSSIKHHVKHKAYPCREVNGVVLTYMGPREKMPLFPNYEWFALPKEHVCVVEKIRNECNYLQALEGDCDKSHTVYLHRGNKGRGLAPSVFGSPLFESQVTPFGLWAGAITPLDGGRKHIRSSVFVAPCIGGVAAGTLREENGRLDGLRAVYQVPADDYNTTRYNISYVRSRPFTHDDVEYQPAEVGPDYRKIASLSNDYLIDREKQHTYNFSGMEGFATQDAAMTESMGPIVDRTQEHLGVSDGYVVAVRRFLLEAVQDFEKGIDPPGLVWDHEENDFSAVCLADAIVAADMPWTEVFKPDFRGEPPNRAAAVWRLG